MGFQTLPEGIIDDLTSENWQRDFDAATMITGDTALLETQLVAHYYISDLNDYLFRADDPGVAFDYFDGTKLKTHQPKAPRAGPTGRQSKTPSRAPCAAQSDKEPSTKPSSPGERPSSRRQCSTPRTPSTAPRRASQSPSVQLQEVRPPNEVQHAFDDVLRAREERDTRINQALAFESRTLPEARGEAEKIRKQAEAYRAERINEATAEANRFLAIHKEYKASPNIIAQRMYLETMDEVLPRTKQVIIAGPDPAALIINTDSSNQKITPLPSAQD